MPKLLIRVEAVRRKASRVFALECAPVDDILKRQGFFSVDSARALSSVHASKIVMNASLLGATSVPCSAQNGQLLNRASTHVPMPMSGKTGFHAQFPRPQLLWLQASCDL